jgi:hypothetical protein
MQIANAFEELSSLLERIESEGWRIEYVETNGERLQAEAPLNVTIGVSSSVLDRLEEGSNVRIELPDAEQSITVLDVTIPSKEGEDANVESSSGSDRADPNRDGSDERFADGRGELRIREGEPEDDRSGEGRESTPKRTATESTPVRTDSEDSGPAHHDPARLREAYENHDTFAEMTDALGVDVSPQTVRHFMIRHGVHEPASHSSSTDAETGTETDPDPDSGSGNGEERAGTDRSTETGADSSQDDAEESDADRDDGERESTDDADTVPPDRSNDGREPESSDGSTSESTSVSNNGIDTDGVEGTDLPDGVSIEDVKRAVESAATVYEVRRELDLDGEETRELLRELDLLDLVTGRLAYKPNQDESLDRIESATASSEEIEQRIRGALTPAGNGLRQAADVGADHEFD